jgi:hypothetical protein
VSSAQRAARDAILAGRPGTRPARPDVASVPQHQRGNSQFDPANSRFDAQPRGDHGDIGTIDPDTPSSSGLTNSGRLHDPDTVPTELQPYVDNGTIINDNGVLRMADPVEVNFNHSNPRHDAAEFDRQVGLQEQSLNQQSVDSWSSNREAFVDSRGTRQEGTAQQTYRETQKQLIAEGYQRDNPGMTPEQARARAEADMQGQVVLHGPDQAAGGNPLQYTGLGDSGINSSLGSQWGGQKGQALALHFQMNNALARSGIPRELWGDVRMNVIMNTTSTVP